MCKHGNVLSLVVLIGRGLDHKFWESEYLQKQRYFLFGFEGAKIRRYGSELKKRTISSVVEHLTLNQGVPGSNP